MTHTVNPYSYRLGILRGWKSRWFSDERKNYTSNLKGDVILRTYLDKRLRGFYVALVEIERSQKEFKVVIYSSRPGLIIGRAGDGIKQLKKDCLHEMRRHEIILPVNFQLDILEINQPEASAPIMAAMIAEQLEKRLPFRRVLKTSIEKMMANRNVLGARILVSGRLGGSEMARNEQIRKGCIPLQTLRADIDFAKEKAYMTYGVIGIKVWIYRGMRFENDAHLSSSANFKEEFNFSNNQNRDNSQTLLRNLTKN